MKKKIEVGQTYPTKNGKGTVQIVCTDITPSDFPVMGIRTERGEKYHYRCSLDGVTFHGTYSLILPDAEPEYRPWASDEVPIGAILRCKSGENHGGRFMILAVNKGVHVSDGTCHTTFDLMFNFEIESGGIWQPCGVQI